MNKMKRLGKIIIFVIMCLCLGVTGLSAQEERSEIYVDFRVNSTHIDPDYGDNARRITQITGFLQALLDDSTISILNVSFCGAASPEGNYQLNRRLARGRLEALEKVVRSRVDVPDSIISRDDNYIPWEHLLSMMQESDFSYKEEIRMILARQPELVAYRHGQQIDRRILQLQQLDGGRAWQELHRRYFSRMRNACVVFVTYRRVKQPMSLKADNSLPRTASRSMDIPTTIPSPRPFPVESWHPHLYIKTNALGLGLAIANAAVEVDLYKHWSFNLPVYYSAWDYFSSTVKFRTFAVQPEVRYWFSDRNDGWFASIHGALAYYNIATDGEYRTQDHDGKSPALGGGLSVGYRLPLSRDGRWKLEASVGAGAYPLHYDKFRNRSNGLLVRTEKKTYVGIDQANLSLSYTFDLKKKGGRR